jgi:hypothetical protein
MSDRWMHPGGAGWLDAVLYDGDLSHGDPLLDGDVIRSSVFAAEVEGNGVAPADGDYLPLKRTLKPGLGGVLSHTDDRVRDRLR